MQWRRVVVLALGVLAGCAEKRFTDRGRTAIDDAGPMFVTDGRAVRDFDAAHEPPPFSRGGGASGSGGCGASCEGTCVRTCIPDSDPCSGIRCPPGHTCIDGDCNADCVCGACIGVRCPAGSYCNRGDGRCVELPRCDSPCAAGELCVQFCRPRDPCDGVACPPSHVCHDGQCLFDPCGTVRCARDEICRDGLCTVIICGQRDGGGGVPGGPLPCPFGQTRNAAGVCVCAPYCPPDARCGEPNGCEGFCTRNCEAGVDAEATADVQLPEPDAGCDASIDGAQIGIDGGYVADCGVPPRRDAAAPFDTGVVRCEPRCPIGIACGAPDGCGGVCPGACGPGQMCQRFGDRGACVCAPRCPTGAWCGQDDGCGGRCYGRCPAGAQCDRSLSLCRCEPYCPPDAWCGQSDGCGGRCRGWCPLGRGCDAAGQCSLCAPHCPPGTACGASDGCGGRCAGSCPAGRVCGPGFACLAQRTGCERDSDCPFGWPCQGGRCVTPCPSGQRWCAPGVCCGAREVCQAGACVPMPE